MSNNAKKCDRIARRIDICEVRFDSQIACCFAAGFSIAQ